MNLSALLRMTSTTILNSKTRSRFCDRFLIYYSQQHTIGKPVDPSEHFAQTKTQWYFRKCFYSKNITPDPQYIDFGTAYSEEEKRNISTNMIVFDSFLNVKEETFLLNEIEPYMNRLRYEVSHWDDAIHAYRETERLKWKEENMKIIDRVRTIAFLPGRSQLPHVHILDLAEEGYIKPHIDSVRFCGDTIAGLSLLTDAVMRLVHHEDKAKSFDVLLKRRSLYIMRDLVRYDYTHEILQNKVSQFRLVPVTKKRRISVICRNEPSSTNTYTE